MLDKLLFEIETEIQFLDETVAQISEILLLTVNREPNKIEIAASSQFVSQFYNGLENILKRIARFNSFALSSSESWHIDLLNLFYSKSDSSKIKLFDTSQYEVLSSYRKIRHIVRQGYNFNIDWKKLRIALENVSDFYEIYKAIITNYISGLDIK